MAETKKKRKRLLVIQSGGYPGNREAVDRILKGDSVPDDQRGTVEVEIGDVVDAADVHPKVVESLLDQPMACYPRDLADILADERLTTSQIAALARAGAIVGQIPKG